MNNRLHVMGLPVNELLLRIYNGIAGYQDLSMRPNNNLAYSISHIIWTVLEGSQHFLGFSRSFRVTLSAWGVLF